MVEVCGPSPHGPTISSRWIEPRFRDPIFSEFVAFSILLKLTNTQQRARELHLLTPTQEEPTMTSGDRPGDQVRLKTAGGTSCATGTSQSHVE